MSVNSSVNAGSHAPLQAANLSESPYIMDIMGSSDRLIIRCGDDLSQRDIKRFADEHGFDNLSEATRELVLVGLREREQPIVYRLKDEMINWAGNLGLMAIIVVLAGFTTPVLSMADAAVLAIGLATTAVTLLAGLELVRATAGINDLGIGIRALVARARGGR